MAHTKTLPGVFELLKSSISLYKHHFKSFVYIALIPAIFNLVSNICIAFVSQGQGTVPAVSVLAMMITTVLAILGIIIQFLFRVALVKGVSDADHKKVAARLPDRYMESCGYVLSYAWICILIGLALVVPSLVFVVPAIVLAFYFSFSVYVLVLENKKGLQAVATSFFYVKNNWWAVFGRTIALGIIAAICAALALGFASALFFLITGQTSISYVSMENHAPTLSLLSALTEFLGSLVILCVIAPIGVSYSYLMYKHLKAAKGEPTEAALAGHVRWIKNLAVIGPFLIVLVMIFIPLLLFTTNFIHR